ncbi:DUF456 domain-containing protein [bacterium]|nr:DUF456 domain-containing protein [bacterium]
MLIIFFIALGSIFIILGFIGCILPALPGPPLSFLGLLMLALGKGFSDPLTVTLMIILAIITIIVSAMDYLIPSIEAKRYGASNWGVFGSIAGMIAGIIFFPPVGMFIGGFLGAILFELMSGKKGKAAMKAGQGVFVGILLGTVLKLSTSGVITYYFVRGLL